MSYLEISNLLDVFVLLDVSRSSRINVFGNKFACDVLSNNSRSCYAEVGKLQEFFVSQ